MYNNVENIHCVEQTFSCSIEYKKIPNKKLQLWRENVRNRLNRQNKVTLEENKAIKKEMDIVIQALEKEGVSFNSTEGEITGLGDVVESTLNSLGVTQEKFKYWFNLRECNCNERKKWLNNLFSWKQRKGDK